MASVDYSADYGIFNNVVTSLPGYNPDDRPTLTSNGVFTFGSPQLVVLTSILLFFLGV